MWRNEYIVSIIIRAGQLCLCILICLVASNCSKKTKAIIISSADDLRLNQVDLRSSNNDQGYLKYNSSSEYIPYDSLDALFPTKYIRLNFHYMNDNQGDKNYKGQEAIDFTYNLIDNANKRLLENHKMKLPSGNKTPALNPKYQYTLVGEKAKKEDNGVYFHSDDELYYFLNKGRKRNNYRREVIDKYAVRMDSVLNVFVMPHHPDSVKSKKYNVSNTGIALGHSIKIAGLYEKGHPFWEYATLLNHEIGHVMGLTHTWNTNDGCDDTPKNANCFTTTKVPPCNETISNNLMDYNSSQMAISPCQLGIIHKNIAKLGSKERALVRHDWCNYQLGKEVIIDTNQSWKGAKDLYADLIIKSGTTLELSGRISLPLGAQILVEKNAKLILDNCLLHNVCGKKWGGISCHSRKDILLKNEVRIIDVLSAENIDP